VPEYYRVPVTAASARVRWLVFPHFFPGATVALQPMTQAESAAQLLQSIFTGSQIDVVAKWRLALALARQAPAHALRYGDLGEAVAAVARVTGALP
jgi:hypothetical protein